MINNHENNEKYIYVVCALGYNADDEPTDTEIFLGEFNNPQEAIAHAETFYDLECISGKPDHPDFEDLYLEEGEYLELRVEQCIEVEEEDEDPYTECVDVLWENALYQKEEADDE